MKKITFLLITILLISFLSGCGKPKNPELTSTPGNTAQSDSPGTTPISLPVPENTPSPSHIVSDPIEYELEKLSLDEKLGQLMIVGFEGYTVNDQTTKLIKEYNVGGFILFSRNVKNATQLLELANSLKIANSSNKVPLFLSIDEEGGRVSRMPAELVKLPSNQVIGAAGKNEISYKIGSLLAEELSLFGINMNFAPILDISSNPSNPVIGDRSFGNNAELVARLGINTVKGLKSGNVIPVVKHFPGHGDTSVDSHLNLPVIDYDLSRLKNFELVPFKEAVNNNIDAVMVAHILLRRLDPANPATLSKALITGILREELSFEGVVITDDLTMGAITKNYSIGSAAVRAINAGTDILLVCHGYENATAVFNALKNAVTDNTISVERIDESIKRILKLKKKYSLSSVTLDNSRISTESLNSINQKIEAVLKEISNSR